MSPCRAKEIRRALSRYFVGKIAFTRMADFFAMNIFKVTLKQFFTIVRVLFSALDLS
jgi:hypothetical protein